MADLNTLREAFVQGLGLPPGSAVDNLVYNTIDEWDSVAHMTLVAQLEDVFDIMLDTDDIIDMSSYAVARTILAKHDVQF